MKEITMAMRQLRWTMMKCNSLRRAHPKLKIPWNLGHVFFWFFIYIYIMGLKIFKYIYIYLHIFLDLYSQRCINIMYIYNSLFLD